MASDDFSYTPPSTWRPSTLGELCKSGGGDIQTGPFGSQLHAADYVADGIPAIMPTNIAVEGIQTDGIARIVPRDAERLSKYRVSPGDIIYSRRGDVEKCAVVSNRESGWLCGTGCLRVRLGNAAVSPAFLHAYLSSPPIRAWVVRHAVGATMPNLNTSILAELPVSVPPHEEMECIGALWASLLKKTNQLGAQNRTLEAIARAIFKSWFVDFDPVRAKAEGREPDGMDADTAALFPSEFEDVELRTVPAGWKVMPVGDLAEVMGGSTPSTKESEYWNHGEHAWATPKDLSSLSMPILLSTDRKITSQGLTQISSGLLEPGTVLLSSRAPIGYLAIAEIPTAINQGFIAMKPKNGVSNLFLLYWTKTSHDAIVSRANGSTFLEISKSAFRPIPVTTPSREIMASFDGIVRPLYEAMVNNEKQSRTLADLRDTLLPRLISGKLRVLEAEKLVEAVL